MKVIKNRTIKAIGFDIGETLVYNKGIGLSWKEHYIPALQKAFNALKIKYSENTLQRASQILLEYNTRINPRTYEVSSEIIFKRIISETDLPHDVDVNQLEDEFFSYFSHNGQELYEDVIISLQNIIGLGYKIGYLTDVAYGQRHISKGNARMVYDKLLSFSTVYLSSVDIGYRKPEVTGFIELADKLDCTCDEMIYVSNEEKDIVGSKKAGMLSCLIIRDKQKFMWGQDITIHSLNDLVKILET